MQIDPSLMPTTLDALHLLLGGAVVILLLLLLILLTIAVGALLRRRGNKPVSVIVERVPAQMIPAPAASPLSVVIEKVPAGLTAPPRETAKAAEPEKPPRIETQIVKEATPDAALQLLSLLQKEARFIDFVRENIASYGDAEIGAAARVVHEGCRKVLNQHFELEPVQSEQENSRITLSKGFDPSKVRITGNIVGQPPFTGTLIHRGWRAAGIKLPKIAEGHDVNILAQAEVEL